MMLAWRGESHCRTGPAAIGPDQLTAGERTGNIELTLGALPALLASGLTPHPRSTEGTP